MKFCVEGVEEVLDSSLSQYSDAFDICGKSMQEALDLIRSDGYEDRKGWNIDCKKDDITVYYKDINRLRFYSARASLPISPAEGHEINWKSCEKMSDWNSNIKYSERIVDLTKNTDIIHYGSNSVMMVKGRQFLCGRMQHVFSGNHVISAKSCTLDSVPDAKDAVRAHLHLAFGRFQNDPNNPSGSIYDYTLCMDLKGMMPQTLLNQIMGKLLLSDMDNTKNHFIQYARTKNN